MVLLPRRHSVAKLTGTQWQTKKPGRYQDGDGLSLLVKPSGSASWVLRVQADGKRRNFGLGSRADISLKEARDRAREYRKLYRDGIDPAKEKKRQRERSMTFREASLLYHEKRMASPERRWSNPKHAKQWIDSLERIAWPALGDIPLGQLENRDVINCIESCWEQTHETARRVLQRIITVANWSEARGFEQTKLNKDVIALGLGTVSSSKMVKPFASLPHDQMPALMTKLEGMDDTFGRLALQFLILTAARSGEIRGAHIDEIDFDQATWSIPGDRMKARRRHDVPLSPAAMQILDKTRSLIGTSGLLFPGIGSRQMSDATLTKAMRSAGIKQGQATVHGFRSSFRTWVAEQTNTPGEIAEAALAHVNRNKVEASYQRSDFFDKRRPLMEAWADFLAGRKSEIIDINDRRKELSG